MTPSMLRNQISDCFNKNELKGLCFDLSIKYENLGGETRDDKSRELIQYCARIGKIERLLELCREYRPHLEWNYHFASQTKSVKTGLNSATQTSGIGGNGSNLVLAGLIIDLSRSMLTNLALTQEQARHSESKARKALSVLLEKVIAYGKTPEANEVFPLLKIFAYGYGFGQQRRGVFDFLERIGFESSIDKQEIPTSSVRDLFFEAQKGKNLPITPSASELDSNLKWYQKSIEAQAFDMGEGKPDLQAGLLATLNRFKEELIKGNIKHSTLFIISTGQVDESIDEQLSSLVNELRLLKIVIVICYVGPRDITVSKKLYTEHKTIWPIEARRLFEYSANVSSQNQTSAQLIKEAARLGWDVPEDSRLFIQLNNTDQLSEFVDFVLKSSVS